MLNRVAFLAVGLVVAANSIGCCCLGGGYGMNRCAPCNNGCQPAYYPPQGQGGFMQGADAGNSAFLPGSMAAAGVPAGVPVTALAPLQALPAY
jgi:hypothetical protein